ncbi:MAG: hypothetical protein ACTSYC_10575 [Promethearchaeota archaeon]
MSKIKKKKKRPPKKHVRVEEHPFIKIIRIAGWFFLIIVGVILITWGLFDAALELIELKLDAISFSFIIFTGTSSALCFGLETKMKNNPFGIHQFFLDWIVGEFIFCLFAIFAVAVYQF